MNQNRINIRQFLNTHFRHFNAAVIIDAAEAWMKHAEQGGKMLLAMAGAMSTGEIGISLAEMIRQDKIQAISTTGANLEEDIFNLVAHNHYKRIPGYRTLSAAEELALHDRGMNRVTDTCIPEDEAMRRVEGKLLKLWREADSKGQRFFHYEYIYNLIKSGQLEEHYEIDPRNSWVVAASDRDLPIFTPGWEDSTLGNMFVAAIVRGDIKSPGIVKSGPEQMEMLINWYLDQSSQHSIGFFQIGGGIAGDFAICVVPLIAQDLRQQVRLWGYFAQISDSTTSFGSYSGAVPNEKITWGKLGIDTPKFIIESDASIVAPLVFSYILDS
jgi:deoxyhypusine synthase